MKWIFGGEKKPAPVEKELSPMERALATARDIKKGDRVTAIKKVAYDAVRAGDHPVALAAIKELDENYADDVAGNILNPSREYFKKEAHWTAETALSYLSLLKREDRKNHVVRYSLLESFAYWGQVADLQTIVNKFKDSLTVDDIARHVAGGLARNKLYKQSFEFFLMFSDAELSKDETFYRLVLDKYPELKAQGVPASEIVRAINILDSRPEVYNWHHNTIARIRKLWNLKIVVSE